MSPPPTIYTPPSELDGTIAGIVITAVVATLGVVILIGMVYRANSHPAIRTHRAPERRETQRPMPAAEPRSAVAGPGKPGSAPPRPSAPDDT
jgi:hypothetical protein